jgi:hypothetical protein
VNAHRLEAATRGARALRVHLLLKGADTIVAATGEGTSSVSSTRRVATAGTGDVLTGILAAFLAKGVEPRLAAAAARPPTGSPLRRRPPGRVDRERRDRGASVLCSRKWTSSQAPSRFTAGDRRGAARARTDGADPDPSRRARRSLAAEIERAELQFRDEDALRRALDGSTRSSTPTGFGSPRCTTFDRAVENTRVLCGAAKAAGAPARVLMSASPTLHSRPLCVLIAAGGVERDVAGSGLSYAIVRPTLVFGPRDIHRQQHRVGPPPQPGVPDRGDGATASSRFRSRTRTTICVDAGAVLRRRARRRRSGDGLLRGARAARRCSRRLAGAIVHCRPPACSPWLA